MTPTLGRCARQQQAQLVGGRNPWRGASTGAATAAATGSGADSIDVDIDAKAGLDAAWLGQRESEHAVNIPAKVPAHAINTLQSALCGMCTSEDYTQDAADVGKQDVADNVGRASSSSV